MAQRKRGPRPSDQLVGLTERDGGFTTKETSGALNPPGTFAAWEDHERVVEGPVRSTDIMQFRRDHGDALDRPGAYFGGYQEEDTTYLDVSRRFVGPTRVERALEFGRQQGQVSVYDVEDDALHYTHTAPDVPEESQYGYSERMAQATRSQKQARKLEPGPERSQRVEHMVDAIFEAQNLRRQ